MARALEDILRRGSVFLWTKYSQLDDPALAGQTKPKFIISLSNSPQDDPIIYILTTSEKPKHANHPFPTDVQRIPAGTYDFFKLDTMIDAGDAGQLDVGRDEFLALYQSGALIYKGALSKKDIDELVSKIVASRRVARRVKTIVTGQ